MAEQALNLAAMRSGDFLELRARGGAGALDMGEVGDQAARSIANDDVGCGGAFGQRGNLCRIKFSLACGVGAGIAQPGSHRQGMRFGHGQIGEQHADIGSRGIGGLVERSAMLRQSLRSLIELARDPAKALRSLLAQGHQLRRHRAKRVMALADPRAEHRQQPFERMRLVAHRDHRSGEAFGLLAAGPPEHQPAKPEQRQRSGHDRNPLRQRRSGQRHAAKRSPGRPCAVGQPQGRQHRERPAKHHPPVRTIMFGARFFPLADVEAAVVNHRIGVGAKRHLIARAFGRGGAEWVRFHKG